MTTRTITAMFDSRAEAERAIEALVSAAGLDRSVIGMEAGSGATAAPAAAEEKGFLASLKELFVPDEDRGTYAEGVRRGGVLVSAQVDEARLDRAIGVLEQHGAVDLDAREAEWRQGGWTGQAGGTAAAAGGGAVLGAVSDGERTGIAARPVAASTSDGAPGDPPGTMLSRGVDQVAGTDVSGAHPENQAGAGVAGRAATGGAVERLGPAADEASIPVVEERLVVGKREVGRGGVRVRSYVVETPVQEQVTLHEEHVRVERRAVDRPLADADQAAFTEKTIEATESAEEAVVAKEVRVVEELVVGKTVEDRTQTVSDTVRHTEVEVDDDRVAAKTSATGATAPGTTPTPDRGRT